MKSKEIRKWMIDNDLNQMNIAPAAGVNQSTVSRFLAGTRKGEKLRNYLIARGCPKKYLADEK